MVIRRKIMWPAIGCMMLGLLVPSQSAAALFSFTGSTGSAQADAGFQMAADYLSSQFSDAVTVNINRGFGVLGPGILGSASSVQNNYTFGNWKAAMAGDSQTADDATMVAGLPGGSAFSLYMNRTSNSPNGSGSATPFVDADGDANNQFVRLSNGNAKALGLIAGNAAAADATITFSNAFSWDFNPTDGIGAGLIDFVGVATHELMHAMGFISGVDILDINSPPVNGPFPDHLFTFVSGLDFTRHSAASVGAGADIDWTADSRAKDFSIDGGVTNLVTNAWSLGRNFGDGRQASHWKDNLGLGLMDPTSAPAGSANVVTALDLQALDVIGWDPFSSTVPEPTTLAIWVAFGGLGLIASRRRRKAA